MQKVHEQDENAELIQRIIDLEQDQAGKVQENRLLMLKLKNFDSAKAIGPKRFELASMASMDRAVYQSDDRKTAARGSITGRSTSSVGKLEPINKGTYGV